MGQRHVGFLFVTLALLVVLGGAGLSTVKSSAAPKRVPVAQGETIRVEGGDIYFDPTEFTVAQGDTIELMNVGAASHDFAIEGYNDDDPVEMPIGGEVVEWTVPSDLPPGTYTFYCTIPGHRQAGMWGTITVVEGEGAAISQPEEDDANEGQADDEAAASDGDLERRVAELEAQVADLEEEVADLEGQVADLEERLAALEAQGSDDEAAVSESEDADTESDDEESAADAEETSDGLSFSGSGDAGLDPFELPSGTYRFSASCDDGFFAIEMVPLDHEEFVFLSLVGMAPYEGSENVQLDGGEYALSVTCTGNWALAIEPLGGRG